MLKLSHLALRRGPRLLFSDVDLTIHAGQRIGLTGANGSGKSSLFALIRNELQPDSGDLNLRPGAVIAHVAQETPATDRSAIDYVLDGDSELREVQRELREAEAADDGRRQGELHDRLAAIGGYEAESRAARLMHGLGFGPEQERQPVTAFSGGWRMRLNLAQALMCRSDLLLLDEPTNHLDLDAVLWLEGWLRAYPGTLLLISHDRDFLDATVHFIAHIERGAIELHSGNYSDFEQYRAERLVAQQAAFERQQREVARMRQFVDRFRAKATKARQAQSRLKALARMELIAPAHADSPFQFSFEPPAKVPNPLLAVERAEVGYADRPILTGLDLALLPGDRIGLLGRNGAGKSTLVKLMAGQLSPLSGECRPARDLAVGYFAQHQLEQLDPDASPLLHLQRLDPGAMEPELRSFLGGFGFAGDEALAPVAPFSGGEKARLVLALLVWQRPNLLLLDEPTNHLDLDMRHALTVALQQFEGALVVVSHDRHLLTSVCDSFWLVSGGGVRPFDGDLDDYRHWLAEQSSEAQAGKNHRPAADHSSEARKSRRRDEAERRRRLAPLRNEQQQLEKSMEELAGRREKLENELADPAIYNAERKEELKVLLKDKAEVDGRLSEVEERWLEVSELLESAEE